VTTSFNSRTALRLALIAAAAASISACATKKPKFDTQPAPPPPPAAQPQGPSTPPPAAQIGQGVLPGSEQDFVVNVGDRVYFDFDKYDLRDDARPLLTGQASWLKRYPNVQVRIEGNTDELGTREYNLALGARRANAVRDFLIAQGVESSRIATLSYGKERPIDPGTGEEAYAKNRNARTAIVGGAQ
jgi:peptidoglycan-associated lipoprotein